MIPSGNPIAGVIDFFRAFTRLLRRKGATTGDRAEGFLAAHHFDDLVVVPGVFGFLRGLDLNDVQVVDHQAVGADDTVAGEHVVDPGLVQFRHDLVGIGGSGGLDRVEIGDGGRIIGRLVLGRFALGLLEEAL